MRCSIYLCTLAASALAFSGCARDTRTAAPTVGEFGPELPPDQQPEEVRQLEAALQQVEMEADDMRMTMRELSGVAHEDARDALEELEEAQADAQRVLDRARRLSSRDPDMAAQEAGAALERLQIAASNARARLHQPDEAFDDFEEYQEFDEPAPDPFETDPAEPGADPFEPQPVDPDPMPYPQGDDIE
jgi:hypothetical protein